MAVFHPPVGFSNQPYLGIATLLFKCQNKLTDESFKIAFPLLIPIMIIRTLKIWESRIHIPFHFLFITISMYISTTKAHGEISVHKDQKLPKNFNSSNWAQIRVEMKYETLIFCCRNSIGTKHILVEVRSAVQML